jgi:cation:H+ antiporter
MLLNAGLLVLSLVVLTVGAEFLVRGAVSVARRFGLSSFFIGLTIVGFGTSTPELCTSLTAAARGSGDLAVGNVVGSNIFNIAVILGITALISPIRIRLEVVRREVLVVLAVGLTPLVAAVSGGRIGRVPGLIMVMLLALYLWRGYLAGRARASEEDAAAERELEREFGATAGGWRSHGAVHGAMIAAGLALLIGGSWVLVYAASAIARGLGVSELVIGLTIVAAGTSAPELVTSLVAAVRGQSDISVGNILGSNIFNILGILGLTCVVSPQQVSRQILVLDLPVMLVVSAACLPIMFSGSRISRGEGLVLLAGYSLYATALFAWAPGWFG